MLAFATWMAVVAAAPDAGTAPAVLAPAASTAGAPAPPARGPGNRALDAKHPRRRAAPPKTHTPSAPPPNVHLAIDATTTAGTWSLRVTNEGPVPVHLIADTRFLTLDVTPRGARSPVRCALPATMLPADVLERAIVLAPDRAFVERFEPRLYCFGPHLLDALAPGAIVVARLGPHATGTSSQPEVSAVDGVEPETSPASVLESPPIGLPDEVTARSTSPRTAADPALDVPKLKLESVETVDAGSAEAVEIPVTLRNEGSLPVTVRFQPEMMGFDVTSSNREERCSWPTLPGAPTRDLFSTVAPKGALHVTFVLQTYCPTQTFDRSGLITVRPWLDTRSESGASIGIRAFEGRLVAPSVTLVRLQRGRTTEPLVRPHTQDR